VARSHVEVARLVALGRADAGIAIPSVARAEGLDFVELAEEPFDLVFASSLARDPRLVALVDALESRAFRRELGSLGGYDPRGAGALVAEVGA
jgi:putative molybdopterin biosynthesis protein